MKAGTHSPFGEGSHTRRNRGPSLPRPQRGFALPVNSFYSATLLYTYISRFTVNLHYQQREKSGETAAINFIPNRFSSQFSTSPTNGPRSLSRVKAGTHSAFGEGSHTAAYTPKQGAFRMGVVSLPSERSARSPTSPGRVYSRRTQRAFGTAMRLCASLFRRRRGPAGLRIHMP